MVLVMDFPGREKLEEIFVSEAYAAILPARDKVQKLPSETDLDPALA